MSNLKTYIEKLKIETETMSDIEKLRYVYIELGKRFVFDLDFSFGNSKAKQKIYYKSGSKEAIEESLENNIIICKTIAKIYEYIMNGLEIKIKTIVEESDYRKYPHVYNILKGKDGTIYIFDLQEDMRNIKSGLRTKYFGISINDELKRIVSRLDLEKIDKKIGYVSHNKWYTDEYLELIKINMNYFSDFRKKVEFVLEEVEAYTDKNIGYADRRWRMEDIIGLNGKDGLLFSGDENSKIHIVDCYKETNKRKNYKMAIEVESKGCQDIYVFSEEKNQFVKMNLEQFANMVEDGWINMRGIQGLKQILRKRKQENQLR